MSKRWFIWIGIVVLAVSCAQDVPETEAFVLRVGASSAPINPEEGTWLAGYSPSRQSTGVHDNLYAKAVVFDDGETPVALVVLDSIGVMYDTTLEIRARAAEKVQGIQLPPERVIVQSTHTHCSPDVIGIYGPDFTTTGRDPEYLNLLIETASDQVAAAAAALEPATLAFAKTEGPDWAVNDSEPGVVDRTVTILQCTDPTGRSIATLTHFACHTTVLDGNTTEVSADWVGAFYATMRENLPGEHLFLQGSIGGWMQPESGERTFARAERYGAQLARKVLAALENSSPVGGTGIRFARKVFEMPNTNQLYRQMSLAGLVPRPLGDSIETEVAWFAVGEAQFATHPGETAPAFTWATHELMDSEPKFVLGLGLDMLGYILKADYFDNTDDYRHAEYLTSMSPGRESGAAMMASLEAIIP